MLKPEYSTVDMAEVELVDDDKYGPRVSHLYLYYLDTITNF